MDITPGEPVPPGFEEEVKKAPDIQSTLDQYKGNALIGVEYTVELHDSGREASYLCVLCDKRGDSRTILSHWASFNHRIKYLEKHFPTVVREFQPVKYQPNSHNILITIVKNLAEAIEDFHGRLQVKMMDSDDFRRQKTRHTESIISGYHYDEKNGPNLLNALDRTLFEHKHKNSAVDSQRKTQKRFNNSPTPGGAASKSTQRKDDFDAISSDSDNPDASKRSKPNSNLTNFANDDREEEQGKKLPTPKELSLQASHIAQERYKWEKYRCMLEIQLKQMEKLQNDYEKSPEKHPHYPEEWKKFWNKRYKELQAEKKVDPNKYDYKPEWIVFWTKRMKEFFNAEVEKIKKDIKIKIGLPEEAEEKVDQLKERYKIPVNRVQRAAPLLGDVIDISDDETPYNRRPASRPSRRSRSRSRSPRHSRAREFRRRSRSISRSRSRSRSRSLSPFSDDYEMSSKHHRGHKSHRPPAPRLYNSIDTVDYYKYSSSSRYVPTGSHGSSHPYPAHPPTGAYRILDSSKIPKYEDTNSKDSKDEPEEETGPLTVVGVLRLLTALEEQLGSLGPKVVDLLGKALALEKVKANSSDDLLLNEDHCVFFETIKEKLKGLLIADVVEDPLKVRAVKRAIKNIAGVIYQVQKGSTNDGEKDNQANESGSVAAASSVAAARKANAKANAPSLKDLPFDRQTIATKLAAALVLHGREDVSTEDMDKLIYLFLLMVKLSKAKRELDGKPLYCKNILPEVGLALPSDSINAMAALAALPAIVEGLLEHEMAASSSRMTPAKLNDNDYESESAADKNLAKFDANSSTLESLTDSDLETLLQNFKHLSSEEQHHLIAHLKKLETVDPERVEKLRKFVNVTDVPEASGSSKSSNADGSKSNFAQSSSRSNNNSPALLSGRNERRERAPGTEPSRPIVNPNKFSLDDDDDDDYNFDEVFKAASKNINLSTPDESSRHSMTSNKTSNDAAPGILTSQNDLTFNPAGLKDSFSDTQNLIANLMGSLQQSNSKNNINNKASSSSILLQPQPVPPIQTGSNQQTNRMPQMQHHQHSQQQQQQQHQHPQQQQQNMAYYQQQQGYQATPQAGAYNQMSNAQANYYNAPMAGGYNQAPYGNNAGYQQWGAPNMQASAYGMHNYGMPPNQMQPTVGYNMYGQGGGN